MYTLGISAYYHDSAAALLQDGEIVAAAQEERFTRKKHDAALPGARHRATAWSEAGIALDEVDHVVFYDKPFLKFERLLETYLAFAPRGFESFRMAMPLWLREKLFLKDLLTKELKNLEPEVNWRDRLLFSEHHLSHAASAFFPSPFDEAAGADHGRRGRMGDHLGCHRPRQHAGDASRKSISRTRSACSTRPSPTTLGFKVNSGEYKVMGLAPYGEPKYVRPILDHLIDLKDDGSFRLDLSYFDYCTGLTMTNAKFARAVRRARRASRTIR